MDGYDEIEERSHRLLGGYQRLRFAAAVSALPPEFSTGELVAAAGLPPTAVSKELKHFAEAGVVRRRSHGKWLRVHDGFWLGCSTLLGELEEEYGPPKPVARLAEARGRRSRTKPAKSS